MEVLVAPSSTINKVPSAQADQPTTLDAMWHLAQSQNSSSALFNEKCSIPQDLFTALQHPTFIVLQYRTTVMTLAAGLYYPQQRDDFNTATEQSPYPPILISPTAFLHLFQHSSDVMEAVSRSVKPLLSSAVGGNPSPRGSKASVSSPSLLGTCLLTTQVVTPLPAKSVTFGVSQPVGGNVSYQDLMHHYVAPFFLDHQRVLSPQEEFAIDGTFGILRLSTLKVDPSHTCALMEDGTNVTLLTKPQSVPTLRRWNSKDAALYQHQQIFAASSNMPPLPHLRPSNVAISAISPPGRLRDSETNARSRSRSASQHREHRSNIAHRRWLPDEPVTNGRGANQAPAAASSGSTAPIFNQGRTVLSGRFQTDR
jgi:hypothetical protein